jgi:tRNA(His) 5'-end guanylyltransferase
MRVTLALNHLTQCPSEDVIPAVQTRLRGLLSHKSCAILFSPAVSGYNLAFKTAYTQKGPLCYSRSSGMRPRGPGGIVP